MAACSKRFPALRALAAGLILTSLMTAVPGCGSDDENPEQGAPPATAPATGPTATAPSAPTPPTDSAGTAPPPAAEPAPPAEPDAGDEEPIRVPATFVLRGGRLTPASITVPAFLAVEVSVVSRDVRPSVLVVAADRRYRLRVPARGRAAVRLPGQRPGTYAVTVDGRRRARLISGGEPGP